jgi:hypothetical protein
MLTNMVPSIQSRVLQLVSGFDSAYLAGLAVDELVRNDGRRCSVSLGLVCAVAQERDEGGTGYYIVPIRVL